MDNQDLYAAIFKGKSVRKYDLTPLADNLFTKISDYVAGLQPLDATIETEMKFVFQKEVHNLLPIKAPLYVVAFSEN